MAIVSPQPRSATRLASQSLQTHEFPPTMSSLASPPRLLSPIHLTESPRRPSHHKLRAATSRCPSQRRKLASKGVRAAHPRRRHCSRSDCPIAVSPASAFETLPWISALDAPLPLDGPMDLADLPLPAGDDTPPHLPGLVRRKRMPTRPNPLRRDSLPAPLSLFEVREAPGLPSVPTTPVRKYAMATSQIRFHDLLPIIPPYFAADRDAQGEMEL